MKTPSGQGPRPRWDSYQRELWLGAKLIRKFLRDAPDQFAVLDAFEARGWPARIDVRRLVPPGASAKAWVKDTVKNMNRGMRRIRFHGNGADQTIGWERIR